MSPYFLPSLELAGQVLWKSVKNLKRLQRRILIDESNDLEVQGIIQSFEFSFELAWKTLKDDLESQGMWIATVSAKPRDRPMRNWALPLKPLAFLQSLTKMHALNPLGVTPWPL